MPSLGAQLLTLVMLAVPIACIAWTVTHEEVFREAREYFTRRSKRARHVLVRKLFYLFTCEYCFSHWVTMGCLAITGFRMLYDDWRGVGVAGFSLVWVANVYMSLFGRLRVEIKHEKGQADVAEATAEAVKAGKIPPIRLERRRREDKVMP